MCGIFQVSLYHHFVLIQSGPFRGEENSTKHPGRSYDCPEGIDDVDIFQGGCSDEVWGRYFPRNWTHGVIKSYRAWHKTE